MSSQRLGRNLARNRRVLKQFMPGLSRLDLLEDRKLLSTVAVVQPLNCHKKPAVIPGTGGTYVAGHALTQPKQYYSENGVLNLTLTVKQEVVNVSGRRVYGMVYNDSFQGPTLHVKPGDQLNVTLVNDMKSAVTDLHTHGLHVSPQGNSDNIFVMVNPHQTFQYTYNIPTDESTGTYWYHSHAHPNTEGQVFDGLSGIIMIDGIKKLLPTDLQSVKEVNLSLKDLQVQANGAIVQTNINSDAPTTRTVNGLVQPKISIAPGETQLWHLANIGADIFYKLQLDGSRFTIIAEDGNPVWNITTATTLMMPPGKRWDVLVEGGPAGSTNLWTLPINNGPWGDKYPKVKLATVVSSGSPQTPVPMPTGGLIPEDSLANAKVDATRVFVFTENPNTNQFYINGTQYNPNITNVYVPLGSVEEWHLVNATLERHPFHIHVNDFQVTSIGGQPVNAKGTQDTVILPVGNDVVIRQRFTQFTGRFVFHCHILAHEDGGMMQVVDVYDPKVDPTPWLTDAKNGMNMAMAMPSTFKPASHKHQSP